MASAIVSGAAHVANELVRLSTTHWREFAPWVGVFFAIHVAFGRVLPWLVPSVYDVFNTDAIANGKRQLTRRELAKDIRTRIVALVFAAYVVALAAYGVWFADDYATLAASPLNATTPLTRHLNLVR